jgi:simple sugar transport system permease protein
MTEQPPVSNNREEVILHLPLTRKSITIKERYYSILKALSSLLLLGLTIIILTGFILVTPTEGIITREVIIAILHFGVGVATPALIALQGEIINENAGTRNMGLEGTMGICAFFCFFAAFFTGSLVLAIIVAGIVGLLVSLFHDFNSNGIKVNSAISGLGINLAMTGLGGFLYLAVFGVRATPPQIEVISKVVLPFLGDIPIWGYILFQQNIITYLALILTFGGEIFLNFTHWGITIKACGQNPDAAATAGINVRRVRTICCAYGGFLGGIGGAYLSLNTGFFAEYIVNGRGWIAYALARLSLASPIFGIFASLIFGVGQALQFRIQGLQLEYIPYEFIWMLPYILTLLTMFIYSIQQKRRRGD